ncbi:S41 family peptidase [Caulobacter sp. 17J80-11]|uniref:S41 family peptidase n=1 Tax=Caulobacter sp. 17J80-11 TaxID=2763502 RepID=UPI00165359C1|nr:S41 family peptidase [Caulobacter sp. 17J80-11]MBC6980282.1 hypothetical protein [Caulobacter sp. 17J80-11]
MRRAFCAAFLAAVLSASPALAAQRSPVDAHAAANLKVFDTVWRRVDRDYYDRRFHGIDWKAVRAEYRPKAEAAADEPALYAVIGDMLGRLKDRHAFASSPDFLKRRAASSAGASAAAQTGPRSGRRPAELRDGAWVVGFDAFDKGSADWLAQQISRVPADAPLVVDLRGNHGGYISELRRSLACLAPEGWVVVRTTSRRGFVESERVGACETPRPGPMAVLVGLRTNSSAELFAAAIQESRRGAIVGVRTGGAVLASREYLLPDGGELSVSIGDARTGAGVRLEGQGVRPDVEAVTTGGDRQAGRDPALARAVEVAAGRVSPGPASP